MRSFCFGARECGDDALHAHEARTLDEHRTALDGAHQRSHVGEMLAAFAETFHRMRARFAEGKEAREAFFTCVGADLAVEMRALRTDLAHVAQHEDRRPRAR